LPDRRRADRLHTLPALPHLAAVMSLYSAVTEAMPKDIYWPQWECLKEGISEELVALAVSQKAIEAAIEAEDAAELGKLIDKQGEDPAGIAPFAFTACDPGQKSMRDYRQEAEAALDDDQKLRREFPNMLRQHLDSVREFNHGMVAGSLATKVQESFKRVKGAADAVTELGQNASEVLARDGGAEEEETDGFGERFRRKRDQLMAALEKEVNQCFLDHTNDFTVRVGVGGLLAEKKKVDQVGAVAVDARQRIETINAVAKRRKEAAEKRSAQLESCKKAKGETYDQLKRETNELAALLARVVEKGKICKFLQCKYNMQKLSFEKLSDEHKKDVADVAKVEADAKKAIAVLTNLITQAVETEGITSRQAHAALSTFVGVATPSLEKGAAQKKTLEVLCDRRVALEEARLEYWTSQLGELTRQREVAKACYDPNGISVQANERRDVVKKTIKQVDAKIPLAEKEAERHRGKLEDLRKTKVRFAEQFQEYIDLQAYGLKLALDSISVAAEEAVALAHPDNFTGMFAPDDGNGSNAVPADSNGAKAQNGELAVKTYSKVFEELLQSKAFQEAVGKMVEKEAEKRARQMMAKYVYDQQAASANGSPR